MASKRKVTMFHPEAGTLRCAPSAVRIHQRRGWHIVEAEAETVTLASADGGVLTTGTVFPPETFDDDVDDD